MGKVYEGFRDKPAVGFLCSFTKDVCCNEKKENAKEGTNEKKVKLWMDYYNDIAPDEIKQLLPNKKDMEIRTFFDSRKNENFTNYMRGKNMQLAIDNPFGFDLREIVRKQNMPVTTPRNERTVSVCCPKTKKNAISFDELVWEDKLKKYVPLQKLYPYATLLPKNAMQFAFQRYTSCLEAAPKNFIEQKDMEQMEQMEQMESRIDPSLGMEKRTDRTYLAKSFGEQTHRSNCPLYTKEKGLTSEKNKWNLNCNCCHVDATDTTQQNSLICGILPNMSISNRGKEKEENFFFEGMKQEIVRLSEQIKKSIITNPENKFMLIQDKITKKTKLVANQKIKKGDVIFLEEFFLETSILFNDLWDTFNNLTENQRKILDEISSYMNLESKYKEKIKNRTNEEEKTDVSNLTPREYEQKGTDNFSNVTNSNTIFSKKEKETESDNFQNIEENLTPTFYNDKFIKNLMEFEKFTSILKNSFISFNDKSKVMLFKIGSFLNHNCFPNSSYCFIEKNKICVVAMRTINMYDEITISVINELYASISYRKQKIKEIKSMECSCNRCLPVVDEDRTILCPVCKYSYVSKMMNVEYMKKLQDNKQNVVKDEQEENNEEKIICQQNNVDVKDNLTNNPSRKDLKNFSSQNHLNKNLYYSDVSLDESQCVLSFKNKNTNQIMIKDPVSHKTSLQKNELQRSQDYSGIERSSLSSSLSYLNKITNKGNNYNEYTDTRHLRNHTMQTESKEDLCSTANYLQRKLNSGEQESLKDSSTGRTANDNNQMITNKNTSCVLRKETENLLSADGFTTIENTNVTMPENYIMDTEYFEKQINLNTNLINYLRIKNVRKQEVGYCKYQNDGTWLCDICKKKIENYVLPLNVESYFISEYKSMKESISNEIFDADFLINRLEKSLLYIIASLGENHWLYASYNYLICDFYFSFYNCNKSNKNLLLKSINSFENFLQFIQNKCPHATHTDLVPLALKFLIICLFTNNYKMFFHYVQSGFLELIRQRFGAWDISYLSLVSVFHLFNALSLEISAEHKALVLFLANLSKTNMINNHFC